MDKHTAQFKYVVKSVLFSVITVPPWSYAHILFYVDIVRVNNILAFKYREYGNIWFCVEGETHIGFSFVLA